LALLEFADHRPSQARSFLLRLDEDDLRGAIPRRWVVSPDALEGKAEGLRHGAAALPTTSAN
jgi:hypothetical protein